MEEQLVDEGATAFFFWWVPVEDGTAWVIVLTWCFGRWDVAWGTDGCLNSLMVCVEMSVSVSSKVLLESKLCARSVSFSCSESAAPSRLVLAPLLCCWRWAFELKAPANFLKVLELCFMFAYLLLDDGSDYDCSWYNSSILWFILAVIGCILSAIRSSTSAYVLSSIIFVSYCTMTWTAFLSPSLNLQLTCSSYFKNACSVAAVAAAPSSPALPLAYGPELPESAASSSRNCGEREEFRRAVGFGVGVAAEVLLWGAADIKEWLTEDAGYGWLVGF